MPFCMTSFTLVQLGILREHISTLQVPRTMTHLERRDSGPGIGSLNAIPGRQTVDDVINGSTEMPR